MLYSITAIIFIIDLPDLINSICTRGDVIQFYFFRDVFKVLKLLKVIHLAHIKMIIKILK